MRAETNEFPHLKINRNKFVLFHSITLHLQCIMESPDSKSIQGESLKAAISNPSIVETNENACNDFICGTLSKQGMKKIFVIDWFLVFFFAITAYSGFQLHYAGHFQSHDMWHNWAVGHTIAGSLFFISGIFHIHTHIGWYKSILSKGLGKKSSNTLWLSLFFAAASISGIILLGVNGANSDTGIWHYRIGIILTASSLLHFVKRFSILKKNSGK